MDIGISKMSLCVYTVEGGTAFVNQGGCQQMKINLCLESFSLEVICPLFDHSCSFFKFI